MLVTAEVSLADWALPVDRALSAERALSAGRVLSAERVLSAQAVEWVPMLLVTEA